jgi:hypothetical protein
MVGTPNRVHTGAAGTRRSAGRYRTKRTFVLGFGMVAIVVAFFAIYLAYFA